MLVVLGKSFFYVASHRHVWFMKMDFVFITFIFRMRLNNSMILHRFLCIRAVFYVRGKRMTFKQKYNFVHFCLRNLLQTSEIGLTLYV